MEQLAALRCDRRVPEQGSGQFLRHLHERLAPRLSIRTKVSCSRRSSSANAYVDLGTWDCLTPFVGVGIGGAWNKFADLTDIGVPTAGSGIGRDSSNVSFAWALHAGLAYKVTQNFTVELAYRYLNYGSVTDAINCTAGCNPDSYKLQNLSSNDFMLGMRWRFPIDTGTTFVQAQPALGRGAAARAGLHPAGAGLSARTSLPAGAGL